jgi:hypothetical protein
MGGMLDTVTDMREISTELTHIVYAVWDYMKNRSGLRSAPASTISTG